MGQERIAIIGAGIAGAATAFFLAEKGLRRLIVFDREAVPGAGSTGRNAAILRTLIPDSLLSGMARQSADFYRHPPKGFSPQPLLNPVGLYLAAGRGHSEELLSWARQDSHISGILLADAAQLYDSVPLLAPGLSAVAYEPREGVLDVHAILQAFLDGAARFGMELRLRTEVLGILSRNGRVVGLETADGAIEADRVVIAGGGWAEALGKKAGCPLPLVPHRRHLLVTEPIPQVDAGWPVVWVVGEEFYFRPESGGLLMCACDAVPVRPEQGESTDPDEIDRIAAKAKRWLPSIGGAGVVRAWAGMRTLAPDHRFVIGPDPRMAGLFWVAGLGGHGITCAPAAGALAAEWIAEGTSRNSAATELSPSRLL